MFRFIVALAALIVIGDAIRRWHNRRKTRKYLERVLAPGAGIFDRNR